MGRNRYVRQKPLTLTEQAYFIKTSFRGFRTAIKNGELRCVGELRPTSTSDCYTIEIFYRIPVRPRIRVLSPELRLAQGCKRLPHVFAGNQLCLYLGGEWRPDLAISRLMIPWVSEWLAYYEDWLVTSEWFGGGHEPIVGKK